MKNIKLEISYDGSKFYGFQIQPDVRTVQGELEKAIKKVTGEDITIISVGRTDTGVHAKLHVSNFITKNDIPAISYKHKLKKYLSDDIIVQNSKEVSLDFNSRYDAISKTYRYIIYNDKTFYPYYNDYKLHIKHKLDIDKMKSASELLLGEHDFSAFMKLGQDKNPVRRVEDIKIYKIDKEIFLEFTAKSFLHNQIRIMVGLLIDIGRGFREVEYVNEIFDNKVKRAAKTYGPQGLYLIDVKY